MPENKNWEEDARRADITAQQRKLGQDLKQKRTLDSYHERPEKQGFLARVFSGLFGKKRDQDVQERLDRYVERKEK